MPQDLPRLLSQPPLTSRCTKSRVSFLSLILLDFSSRSCPLTFGMLQMPAARHFTAHQCPCHGVTSSGLLKCPCLFLPTPSPALLLGQTIALCSPSPWYSQFHTASADSSRLGSPSAVNNFSHPGHFPPLVIFAVLSCF